MMGTFDYALLTLIGVYAVFVARRVKKRCSSDCGACRGCERTK